MNNKNDFTQGNILGKMLRFMLPILGALVLQAMYSAVDVLVVGQFGTTSGISGVSTGSSVIHFVVFVIAGLSMGVTVQISHYLGERHPEEIGKVIGGAILLYAGLAVVFAILLLVFARPLAILMQAPPEAVDLTVLYIRICGGGIFFIIAYNMLSSIFRGLGDSQLPLLFVGIACVVNILGDLFFVAVLGMNVVGAAIATVLAQAVSVILSLRIIRKRELPFTMTRKDICWNPEIGKFVKIGLPIAFQEIMTQISFLALCAFINRLGLSASSGYGVAHKIVSFVMLIPSSIMQSMASFVSQNVGAKKQDRARRSMLTGMAIGSFIGIFIGLFSYLRGDLLAEIFTADPAVIERTWQYLRGFAPEAVVTAILFSFMGYFNGQGKTVFVMAQGLAQTFLVRLPVSYFMSIQPEASLTNIGWAAPSATIFGIFLCVVYFIYFNKTLPGNRDGRAVRQL